MTSSINYPKVPRDISATEGYLRSLVSVIELISSGKINVTGEITLDANSSSTVFTNQLLGVGSVVNFMPVTANAAAVISSVYISDRANGEFTITHANDANTDKIFRFSIIG